ncbi:hypothetical protein B0J12DRAFT_454406 [Macrophomina phaseolina]|uniref:Uncharacterized protein n=1 Tax=Macrophomina phaseolina TaxID=35725 RepID=A0ABQ8GIN3_9PEZI|nr:hypothetical protein B0J12DRAFT_454406 [Macrophomina phaseolina]
MREGQGEGVGSDYSAAAGRTSGESTGHAGCPKRQLAKTLEQLRTSCSSAHIIVHRPGLYGVQAEHAHPPPEWPIEMPPKAPSGGHGLALDAAASRLPPAGRSIKIAGGGRRALQWLDLRGPGGSHVPAPLPSSVCAVAQKEGGDSCSQRAAMHFLHTFPRCSSPAPIRTWAACCCCQTKSVLHVFNLNLRLCMPSPRLLLQLLQSGASTNPPAFMLHRAAWFPPAKERGREGKKKKPRSSRDMYLELDSREVKFPHKLRACKS